MVVKAEDAEKNRFTMNPGIVVPQCATCLNFHKMTRPEWPTCMVIEYQSASTKEKLSLRL